MRAKSDGTAVNRTRVVGLLAVLVMSAGLVLVASSPALAETTFTVRFTGDQPDFSVLRLGRQVRHRFHPL